MIWHAESVMIEPWDSLPHDNHLHLRLACTPDEAVAGCLGGGPYWPWLAPLRQIEPLDDGALIEAIVADFGEDHELDTTVLLPALVRLVVGDGLVLPVAHRGEAGLRDAPRDEGLLDALARSWESSSC